MKKKNNCQKLKALRQEQQKQHQAQVTKMLDETKAKKLRDKYQYKETKKLFLWHYLIVVIITSIIIGFSFIIGIFAFKNIKKTEWVIVAFLIVILLIWLLLGWYKNRQAARYFNDVRRRYEQTLTLEEATLKKWQKILIIIALLLLISSLIIYFSF